VPACGAHGAGLRRAAFTRRCLLVLVGLIAACGGVSRPAAGPPASVVSSGTVVHAPAPREGHGLLVVRDRQLLVRDMTSGTEREIRRAPPGAFYAYPRWSPDGARIAYVVTTLPTGAPNEDWGSNVAVSAADGTDEQLVFQRGQSGTQVEGIEWTADGAGLYLGILEQEMRGGLPAGSKLALDRLDLASGARTTIAGDAAYPTAAPGGGRIAFLTFGNDGRPGGLWTARPDGTDRTLLLRAANPGDRFAGLRWPRFSPDGSSIAFGAVEAANADLSPPACRTGLHWPWQPRIAAAHGPPIDIWLITSSGGEPRKVADLREDDPYLAWSPDGTAMAVIATCGLYRLSLGSEEPQKIGPGGTQLQIDWR
jgi:Tol biopolymer transport system component